MVFWRSLSLFHKRLIGIPFAAQGASKIVLAQLSRLPSEVLLAVACRLRESTRRGRQQSVKGARTCEVREVNKAHRCRVCEWLGGGIAQVTSDCHLA